MSHTRFVDNGTTMDRRNQSKKQITMEHYTHHQHHYNSLLELYSVSNSNCTILFPLTAI